MKKIAAFLVLTFTLVMLSTSAFAWGPKIDEKPNNLQPGKTQGYFIWRDKNGFQLWTTTMRGQSHVFTGTITTDGERLEVRSQGLENGNSTPFGSFRSQSRRVNKDSVKVDNDRDTIRFKFDNSGGDLDGINFRVAGGSKVKFDLYMDGKRIDPNEIFIGDEGWHPGRNVFTMYR